MSDNENCLPPNKRTDLLIGRATLSRFLLGSGPALIFHLVLVESHGRIVCGVR
jgi:hypothetical protein